MLGYDNEHSEIHTELEDVQDEPNFIQHRVFLNYIDTHFAKYIASYLTDQIYGATKVPVGGAGEGEEALEEENDEEGGGGGGKTELTIGGEKYQIVGCLQEKFHKTSEDIFKCVATTPFKETMAEILKCGFIIFNVHDGDINQILLAQKVIQELEQEILKMKELGPKTYANIHEMRTFILVSNYMTWGLTKPIDPEEPDTAFTEADYRKRRAHPNYKEYLQLEKDVTTISKKYKDKLKAYVICSGLIYGMEEDDLSFYFKMAWNNSELPIFGGGNNFVPFIHIKDLAKVIHGVCENIPNRPNYILAVEQTPCKFRQFVKALAKAMGNGFTKEVSQEEAFLYNNMTQRIYEMCTVNLNMEPSYITDELEIEWQNELNIAENMAAMVNEFRQSRGLNPMRIYLHGPPASGKTKLAKRLCEIYGTHYISISTMIEEKINELKSLIEREKKRQSDKEKRDAEKAEAVQMDLVDEDKAAAGGEEEEEEEPYGDIEEMEEQLRDIENNLHYSETQRLPDDYVLRLVKELLEKNICQNQGYVLDGYPKTLAQAKNLFGQSEGAGGEEAGEEGGEAGPKILPDFVISLEATDDFLCNRIMSKPEADIQGTHYEEEPMLRRLAEFRMNNTEDNTVLNFFDEMEIHPKIINVMEYPDDEVDGIIDKLVKIVGPPVLFEPTVEEERETFKLEQERKDLENEEAKLAMEINMKKAANEYLRRMEEWSKLLEELQNEEEKILTAQCEPIRKYLMDFVFPILGRGLIETARIKPDDPVDFLAEYLFRENPEGRMFDPRYTRAGTQLEKKAKTLASGENINQEDQNSEQVNNNKEQEDF